MEIYDPRSGRRLEINPLKQWLFLRWARAHFIVRQARTSARRGDWPAAARAYEQAASLTPASPAVWTQLGHSLKEAGDRAPAAQAYKNVLALRPAEKEAYCYLGFLLADLDRWLEARAVLARAFALDPGDAEVRTWLSHGQNSEENGEYEEISEFLLAAASRQIAQHLPPAPKINFAARIVRRAARKAARFGRWADAEAAYRRLVRRRPLDHGGWLQLGHALKEQGHFDLAEYAYRRAIITNVIAVDAFVQLGHILKLQGRPLPSRQAYILAWQSDPGREDIRLELREADMDEATIERLAIPNSGLELASIKQREQSQAMSDPLVHRLSIRTFAIYERLKLA